MSNEEVVRHMLEDVSGRGKLDMIDDLCDASYVNHDSFAGDLDRAQLKQSIARYRAAFPDLTCKVIECVSAGDKVFCRFRTSGTHKGMLGALPPTGRTFTSGGTLLATIREGKIVEDHLQWNTLKWLQDLGLVASNEQIMRPRGAAEARPS